MTYKINICSLSLGQLNGACLMRISKFARILELKTGLVLDLKDDQLINKLVKITKCTDDSELLRLYSSIKQEIKRHINGPYFDKFEGEFIDTRCQPQSFGVSSGTKH